MSTDNKEWTVERHGNGWAIYRGRDTQHHGFNMGQLTESCDGTAELIERALNALSRSIAAGAAAATEEVKSMLVNELVEHGKFLRDGAITEAEFIRAVNHYINGNWSPSMGSAGAMQQPVARLLTEEEIQGTVRMALKHRTAWSEDIQRKFCEVNGIRLAADAPHSDSVHSSAPGADVGKTLENAPGAGGSVE